MPGTAFPNKAVAGSDPVDSLINRNNTGQVSVEPDGTVRLSAGGGVNNPLPPLNLALGHNPAGTAAAVVIGASGTIVIGNGVVTRVAPSAARAGIIMPLGTYDGQLVIVVNESAAANTLTFAAAGTSNVADGVAAIIAGLTHKIFVWDSATSLWYHTSLT